MAGRGMELSARRSCRGQETAVIGVWRGAHVLECSNKELLVWTQVQPPHKTARCILLLA